MGVTVAGLMDVENLLVRVDMNTKKRITLVMVNNAIKIKDLAIKMAPVDEANLEKAIKVRPENAGRIRNEAGQFQRQEIEVYIDMNMAVPGRPGKRVGDYAYEMHEHLTPLGPLKLGPKSQAKNGTNGVQVGGGFLTRAAEQVTQTLMEEIELNMFG